MRHPTRFLFPAFLLGVFAVIACSGSATAFSTRSLGAAVTGGVNHTCALTRAGGVQCWGYNGHDELGTGDGTLQYSVTPVGVAGLNNGVTVVSAGVRHSCAVTSSGGATCWGANYGGALGDGTSDRHGSPVAVLGLSSGVMAVSAGSDNSCALLATGGVKCWGTRYALTPGDVPRLSSGVTAISAGQGTVACALTNSGSVKCWGRHWGPTPVDLPGLSGGVTALATGFPRCVLTSGGGVKCWGSDTNWSPVDVPGLGRGVTGIAAGLAHACALTSVGGVKCWGSNEFGQLGDGTTIERSTPGDVSGLTSGVAALAAGTFHTCAVMRAGGVKCWGPNAQGMLGDGTETSRLRPVDVVGFGPPPAQCVVPNVVGKRLAKARVRIVRAHCRVGTVARVASTRSKNFVVRQRPRPGKRLKAGSRIDLRVSSGH
jgi:Regulator of chromosome condensation (RCC1) repeat/PASTA domain